jgi:hypothetical protein
MTCKQCDSPIEAIPHYTTFEGKRVPCCSAGCVVTFQRQRRYEQAQRSLDLGKAAFNGA